MLSYNPLARLWVQGAPIMTHYSIALLFFIVKGTWLQGCPEVDLLIRTSGEHRLSDFLLWQSSYAQLVFSDTLWPDYSFWNLLQALVQYQRSYPDLQKLRPANQQAAASVSSQRLEDSMTVRQSSRQTPGGSQSEACSTPLAVSAETHQTVRRCKVGKGPAGQEVTDADTSDSSASSESGPASPNDSPARLARSRGPLRRHDEGCIHSGEHSCQSCNIAPAVGQQVLEQTDIACASLHPLSSSPALEPLVAHNSKVPLHTLHADVDCRTTSLPSLNRRHPYRPLRDLS